MQAQQVEGIRSHIKTITGIEPLSCPWRAFNEPIVRLVIDACVLAGEQMRMLNDDDLAVLWDATPIYVSARNATRSHDMEEDRKKREAEAKKRKHG